MNLRELFPTVIGFEENKNHHKEKHLIKHCKKIKSNIGMGGLNWSSGVYNTSGTYPIHMDKEFDNLNSWIFAQVYNYIAAIGFLNCNISVSSSWFNFYKQYDYQEMHNHLPDHDDISAVYFLKSPKGSGNLVFNSHEPVGKNIFNQDNPYTWKTFEVPPKEGLLVIFKSNMFHQVKQNKSKDTRISFAYNFKIKENR